MKKLITTFVFLLVLVASPRAMVQMCNPFDATALLLSETSLSDVVSKNNTGDLVAHLNSDGGLPFGISGNFNNLEDIAMTYATDGSPRFVRRSAGWSAVGTGVNFMVHAMAVSGSDVYVGGGFTTAGGTSANYIAKWDGSSWSALGTGVSSYVYAIAVSGSDVYVGGDFTTAGGTSANYIAKWNGSSWSALGTGVNDTVRAVAVSGSDVYVGGYFTSAGGITANRIAKWNGRSWSALGIGMSASPSAMINMNLDVSVDAIAVSGSDVYVGGFFTSAGGTSANHIAKWNGNSWSALGTSMSTDAYVRAIAVSGNDVYVGGFFRWAGGISANHIAKWDGRSWSALGTGVNSEMYAIMVSGSNVYVGGSFTMAGGTSANHIAKWDGRSWSALGTGVNGSALAITRGHNGLYVGGFFTSTGSSMQGGNIQEESKLSVQQSMVAAKNIAYYTDTLFPTSFVSASASVREQIATLKWETANETTNEDFIIEQQTPQGWKQVGEVKGAGLITEENRYSFHVPNLAYGHHTFRLAQIGSDGSRTYSNNLLVIVALTDKFAMSEAYPNPFNPSTNFTLALATDQRVEISVYDLMGRKLQTLHNGILAANNTHNFTINASDLTSGRYFVRVQGDNFATSKMITLVK